ncbi:MAG: VapC toxin family PIN domain ribonuclease [Verrucomicrobia bacterium]|nr:VapC toxin family PIN domain ribonuclease [Verrucomicrobiota bacterium]
MLDLNFLIALAWNNHSQHDAAHAWLSTNSETVFATCNVTQSGFLRLFMNPNVIRPPMDIKEAIRTLNSFTSRPAHVFWEDGAVDVASDCWPTVAGHNQVPDTNLFLIARRHGGKLLTFDTGIKNRLPHGQREGVEVVV